ncbi:MAG: alpha-2-macroglobulin family protein [Myxococcota bacterium]
MNARIFLLIPLMGCGAAAVPLATFNGEADEAKQFASFDMEEMPAEPRPQAEAAPAPPPRARPAPKKSRSGGIAPSADGYGALGGLGYLADSNERGKGDDKAGGGEMANEGVTRSWFPETFLFEPRIETDDQGNATIPVMVPDRLTSWRVLGLAHSRTGALAGDTLTFQGTLPIYVDPILPPFLRAGDALNLPVQVVNTTAETVDVPLAVSADGAGFIRDNRAGAISLGGGDSAVRTSPLVAERAGTLTLRASIGEDAVEKTVEIQPIGRPVSLDRGGTLAAPRSISLVTPADADPDGTRARLLVYPGALAVLRTELSRVQSRGGVANDAYALLLSGRAPGLLENLNGEVDEDALRELRLISTQRVIRHARSPDVATATLLAEAALSHPDDPILTRMGQRLVDQLVRSQRPDGTFQGGDRWTVQRLLVATAEGSAAIQRAARRDEDGRRSQQAALAKIKAQGAFERLVNQADDAYTAAAILASGGATGELADTLRARVRGAVIVNADDSRSLLVGEGVVRADGQRPSMAEATALAVLALKDDPEAPWLADLGATLLSRYSPGRGWGDGRTNLVCLQAVLQIFDAPLPAEIQLTLKLDGKVIDEDSFNRDALREVVFLEAAAGAEPGAHTWAVEATPAVPGLGFSLTLQTYVPWEEPEAGQGLELAVEYPERFAVGQPATLQMKAAAPSRTPFVIEHRLPAGVQTDEDSLQRLVSTTNLSSYEVEDGLIRMEVSALEPGAVFDVSYTVIPTLGGTLHSGPLSIAPQRQEALAVMVPPRPWIIQ